MLKLFHPLFFRAQKRMDNASVFGRKISVHFANGSDDVTPTHQQRRSRSNPGRGKSRSPIIRDANRPFRSFNSSSPECSPSPGHWGQGRGGHRGQSPRSSPAREQRYSPGAYSGQFWDESPEASPPSRRGNRGRGYRGSWYQSPESSPPLGRGRGRGRMGSWNQSPISSPPPGRTQGRGRGGSWHQSPEPTAPLGRGHRGGWNPSPAPSPPLGGSQGRGHSGNWHQSPEPSQSPGRHRRRRGSWKRSREPSPPLVRSQGSGRGPRVQFQRSRSMADDHCAGECQQWDGAGDAEDTSRWDLRAQSLSPKSE